MSSSPVVTERRIPNFCGPSLHFGSVLYGRPGPHFIQIVVFHNCLQLRCVNFGELPLDSVPTYIPHVLLVELLKRLLYHGHSNRRIHSVRGRKSWKGTYLDEA